MDDDRILVQVPVEALPPRAQALLDPAIPRPAGSRFLARRTHLSWVPAAWLVGLLAIGISSLRATLAAGLDPLAGAERIIYGALAAVCLVGALFAAAKLAQGLAERWQLRRGDYRRGLHLLSLEGLLIAGRDRHTWVPRVQLPAPQDVTDSVGGGNAAPSYAYVIVDGDGRIDRLDCGALTQSALRMWAEYGQLPEGGGWV
jgi:hypothetical protein